MQVRRRREGHPPDVVQRHFGGEADDRVAFVVESAAPRATGHLRVLGAGEELAAGVGVLRELLQRDRARRHVDAEGQRLGREHDREQVLLEAGLDDLAKGGHHAGVVHGDAPAKAVDEVGVLQRVQVLVGEVR